VPPGRLRISQNHVTGAKNRGIRSPLNSWFSFIPELFAQRGVFVFGKCLQSSFWQVSMTGESLAAIVTIWLSSRVSSMGLLDSKPGTVPTARLVGIKELGLPVISSVARRLEVYLTAWAIGPVACLETQSSCTSHLSICTLAELFYPKRTGD
jgi:hypothetical protein